MHHYILCLAPEEHVIWCLYKSNEKLKYHTHISQTTDTTQTCNLKTSSTECTLHAYNLHCE